MSKYAVLGIGRFGQNLAIELTNLGNEVLAVDLNEEHLAAIQEYVTHVAIADITDEDAVRDLGIEDFDGVIIGVGHDIQNSIMCAIICKELNVPKLWAKASTEMHAKALIKIGVDRAILVEKEMGIRVAHHMAHSNIVDYIALSDDYQMAELEVKPEWINKTISQINFRNKYGLNIIGVRRGEHFNISALADYTIMEKDVLCVIGKNSSIDKL
ncbi:MAG: TrkA family potassium uptake protein [Clostridia bacterium]|nr:TrkA family potassium uptake protein [Clostridia bacterium]